VKYDQITNFAIEFKIGTGTLGLPSTGGRTSVVIYVISKKMRQILRCRNKFTNLLCTRENGRREKFRVVGPPSSDPHLSTHTP